MAGYRAALDNPGLTRMRRKFSEMNNILHRNPKMQWALAAAGAVAHPVTERSAERLCLLG